MTAKKPALLLLPNLLGEQKHHEVFLPGSVDKAVKTLDGLFSESESGGRRFLGHFELEKAAHLIPLALVNEHTPDADLDFLLQPLVAGERWGLVSDAGTPCIADPGYKLVRRARQLGIQIQAFVGPSAITMALMLSGLPAQRFAFRGYLPKDSAERMNEMRKLEQASQAAKATQIFIEAPYRNTAALEDLLKTLHPSTWLCVAWDLTLPTQGIVSQLVAHWKRTALPNLEKKPAIFLVSAEGAA
ncbi:MAG: SAM-dependent methyltransferase [Chlamydiales bacterium]|nr:SAM-dependent methyltransferase [Chlamydiales bacterium]